MINQKKSKLSSNKFYILRLNDRISLRLYENIDSGLGDSAPLQKGLVIFVNNKALCGEGVGFGVPALKYHDKIFFSTHGSIEEINGELVKRFSINSFQRKTWGNKVSIDNRVYLSIENKLADLYRDEKKFRRFLAVIMRIISLLGFKLGYLLIASKGLVEMRYSLSRNKIKINVNSSRLLDRQFNHLLIFNEQSSDFDLYRDRTKILRKNDIGVWEKTDSEEGCLTNNAEGVTFCVKNISDVGLYRGRELLRPRLDWAGFCYSIPSNKEQFEYMIDIS